MWFRVSGTRDIAWLKERTSPEAINNNFYYFPLFIIEMKKINCEVNSQKYSHLVWINEVDRSN